MSAVLVGGGPDAASNAAQIEGHTKFVASLLTPGSKRVLLFADGSSKSENVYRRDTTPVGEARHALEILLPEATFHFGTTWRPPALGYPLDGPARYPALRNAITGLLPRLGKNPTAPLLLYFAGHGSTTGEGESTESTYQLWKNETLTVRDLATQIARLPTRLPIVLVMAQCYSGGFGQILFREGQRKGELIPQNVAGFFSAHRDRTASGCGSGTTEADYQDFSSYFFAALAGHDQFAHPAAGADYDQDGHVNLHEAFCYALLQDESFDTPNCTSDLFLRHSTKLGERKVYETPYAEVLATATPAQHAVLEGLSERLELQGEMRALSAFDRLHFRDPPGRSSQLAASRTADDKLSQVRENALADLFSRWPALRWSSDANFKTAAESAVQDLAQREQPRLDLLALQKEADLATAVLDNEEAFLMRFIDVYASVVLARELQEHGSENLKNHFGRIWAAEQQTLSLHREH